MNKENNHMSVKDVADAVNDIENGYWHDVKVPMKTHTETVTDFCDCCGQEQGEREITVIDEYRVEREYVEGIGNGHFKPGYMLHPRQLELLLQDEDMGTPDEPVYMKRK